MGTLVVRDNGIEVLEAPNRIAISLSLLIDGKLRGISMSANWILIGHGPSGVAYKAVGVSDDGTAIIADRIH